MHYSDLLLAHFHSPHNVGEMPDASAVGEAQNAACLDTLRLYLRVEGDVIRAATFQAQGCVPSLAVGSILTEHLAGMSLEQARQIDVAQIERAVGGLPCTKMHAAYLALDALQDALAKLKPHSA